MEYEVNTQGSVMPTLENKRPTNKTPKLLLAILAIMWLFYIPFASLEMALTAMIFDNGSTPKLELIYLLINGVPFVVMLISTVFAVRRRSYLIALLPVFIFTYCYWLFF
jgi:hypothetical protein